MAVASPPRRIPTWDLPVRLCHWLLVALVIDAWISNKFGDIRLRWHLWNGYAILTLLVFRIIWGFVGSSTARFTNFMTGWSEVVHYLKSTMHGNAPSYPGHNPAGGWSVAALLSLLTMQGLCGLFASDDIMASGPLNFLVSETMAGKLSTLHSVGFWLLLGMITVHLSAVFFYLLFKKDNLITPMITGVKHVRAGHPEFPVRIQSPWLALPVLIASASLVWLGIQVWKW
ncbi:MAG: cytochrome b/b6 domain-containing protein [Magnetococcales bacterium]|nr:cytochrome b/b6 domain-containing protein [Magnetococcales bacterium]